jgi:protein-glutamine gamma-glutamyltransferase
MRRRPPWLVALEAEDAGAGAAAAEPAAGVLGRPQWSRAPLWLARLAILGAAAAAITWGVVGPWGVAAAVLGAVLGAALGHGLALGRLRAPLPLVGAAALGALSWWLGRVVVTSSDIVDWLGPAAAMQASAVVRFGLGAAALAGAVRVLAVRVPALLGLELLAVVLAVVVPLSPHRDGVVARPLWLSDWATEAGLPPAVVLLGIGGGLTLVLGFVLLSRPGRRVSVPSGLALVGIVVLAVSMLDVAGLPEPQAGNDLGLTGNERGDDPLPTPPGHWEGGAGRGQPERDEGKGGGAKPQDGEGGGAKPQDGEGGSAKPQEGEDGGAKPQEGEGGGAKPQEGEGGGAKPQEGEGGGQSQAGKGGGQSQAGKGGGQSQAGKGGGGKPPDAPPPLDEDGPPPSGSPAPMAVVLLGDDYEPPSGGLYFRQDAWSHWNGTRLVDARRPDVDRDVPRAFPSTRTEVAAPPPEDGRQPVRGLVFLAVKHKRPFSLESPLALAPEKNPEPARFVRAYGFEARAQSFDYGALLGRATHDPAWGPEVRDYYARMPDDPRYAELAAEIVQSLPPERRDDPFAQALAIKLWLDDHITYSQSERHAGAADPTADFLFGSRIGYCVHIAHAAVLLWRARGIAARVGTGYRGRPDDLRGAALVLRSSDAHAWPELHLEDAGWIVLDVAPKQTLDPPAEPADDELTQELAELARKDAGHDDAKGADPSRGPPQPRPPLPAVLLLALAAAVLGLYVAKLWRRLAPRLVRGPALPRAAWRRASDQLAELGLVRALGETRSAFAQRAHAVAPSLVGLAALTEAAQLGDPAVDPRVRPERQRAAFLAALHAVTRDLRAHVPAGRRVRGVLNPFAFLSVR